MRLLNQTSNEIESDKQRGLSLTPGPQRAQPPPVLANRCGRAWRASMPEGGRISSAYRRREGENRVAGAGQWRIRAQGPPGLHRGGAALGIPSQPYSKAVELPGSSEAMPPPRYTRARRAGGD